jgi:hypothetical protein
LLDLQVDPVIEVKRDRVITLNLLTATPATLGEYRGQPSDAVFLGTGMAGTRGATSRPSTVKD